MGTQPPVFHSLGDLSRFGQIVDISSGDKTCGSVVELTFNWASGGPVDRGRAEDKDPGNVYKFPLGRELIIYHEEKKVRVLIFGLL